MCNHVISIHALRVEGDFAIPYILRHGVFISIHALRVEGDIMPKYNMLYEQEFLSTPSGWRATNDVEKALQAGYISIHALRVEGDYPAPLLHA